MMSLDNFCCPVCKGVLIKKSDDLCCGVCEVKFPIVDGIPDFFISETNDDWIDQPNKTWMDPKVVEARDTVYRLCARDLKGMTFCMQEIGKRTSAECRILEVGMGTGHFTRWLAEVSRPGTQICAFDFSWPIIEKAKINAGGFSEVSFFRANARGRLPIKNESFDIVFLRLAPLGAQGIPNVQAGFELLRPGGWYFEAGWEHTRYETPPTEWAIQHGFESAQHHKWQYWRTQTEPEQRAFQIEQKHLSAQGCLTAKNIERESANASSGEGSVQKMTHENLLIAHKPFSIK